MNNKCENCGKCCIDTQMMVSERDIDLIIRAHSNSFKMDDFVYKDNMGFYKLRNFEGHCVFFRTATKDCVIYKIRPQGCRFYPLVYDYDYKECVCDFDCPRTRLFYQNKIKLQKTCKKLKEFLKFQLHIDI